MRALAVPPAALRRGLAPVAAALSLAAASGCDDPPPPRPPPVVDTATTAHGPVVAEVGPERAVLWARTDEAGHWRVVVRGAGLVRRARVPVGAEDDGIARAVISGLVPAATYDYAAWFVVEGGREEGFRIPEAAVRGSFQTAPPADAQAPVSFVFGADLAGQNVCRHGRTGFPIFEGMGATEPDFFLALGDMIYADDPCLRLGRYVTTQVVGLEAPAETLDDYRAAWRYTREDEKLAAFLAKTPLYATWDDHEIGNDAHPGTPRFAIARRAFREWNPVIADGPGGFHRRIRWGKHLDIFLLDTRSFRAPQAQPDTGDAPKTLLGAAQKRWLLAGLADSDATWKLVATTVPLSIPTGAPDARDGWADGGGETGYERELGEIVAHLQREGVADVVFLSGDVHFASVIRYRPDPEGDPGFFFHEITAGPLQAGLFPREDLDETFGPNRRFFYGPPKPDALAGWSRVTPWFNFGHAEVSARGELTLSILGVEGNTLFRTSLVPAAAAAAKE